MGEVQRQKEMARESVYRAESQNSYVSLWTHQSSQRNCACDDGGLPC